MNIDCYLAPGCGSEQLLRQNIETALGHEGVEARVRFHHLDPLQAGQLGLHGSPTVLVEGEDIEPLEAPGFA